MLPVQNEIPNLPTEMWYTIFPWLDEKARSRVAQVCKLWNEIISDASKKFVTPFMMLAARKKFSSYCVTKEDVFDNRLLNATILRQTLFLFHPSSFSLPHFPQLFRCTSYGIQTHQKTSNHPLHNDWYYSNEKVIELSDPHRPLVVNPGSTDSVSLAHVQSLSGTPYRAIIDLHLCGDHLCVIYETHSTNEAVIYSLSQAAKIDQFSIKFVSITSYRDSNSPFLSPIPVIGSRFINSQAVFNRQFLSGTPKIFFSDKYFVEISLDSQSGQTNFKIKNVCDPLYPIWQFSLPFDQDEQYFAALNHQTLVLCRKNSQRISVWNLDSETQKDFNIPQVFSHIDLSEGKLALAHENQVAIYELNAPEGDLEPLLTRDSASKIKAIQFRLDEDFPLLATTEENGEVKVWAPKVEEVHSVKARNCCLITLKAFLFFIVNAIYYFAISIFYAMKKVYTAIRVLYGR